MFKIKNHILFLITIFIMHIVFAMEQQIEDKDQALIEAADTGDLSTVKELINQGANVNARDKRISDIRYFNGSTALIWAIAHQNIKISKLLIKSGANVNMADTNKLTPFMRAAIEGNEDLIDRLIDAGANILAKDNYNDTAIDKLIFIRDHLHSRRQIDRQKIINLLENKVQEIKENIFKIVSNDNMPISYQKILLLHYSKNLGGLNVQNKIGETPLHIAIRNSNFNLAKWILDSESSLLNKENNSGQTTLELGYGLWANSEDWHKLIENLKSEDYISQEDIDMAIKKHQSYIQKELEEVKKTFMDLEQPKI